MFIPETSCGITMMQVDKFDTAVGRTKFQGACLDSGWEVFPQLDYHSVYRVVNMLHLCFAAVLFKSSDSAIGSCLLFVVYIVDLYNFLSLSCSSLARFKEGSTNSSSFSRQRGRSPSQNRRTTRDSCFGSCSLGLWFRRISLSN